MYQVFSKHMLCLLFISLTKIASGIFKNILSIKMTMVSLPMKQKGLSVMVTWVSDCLQSQANCHLGAVCSAHLTKDHSDRLLDSLYPSIEVKIGHMILSWISCCHLETVHVPGKEASVYRVWKKKKQSGLYKQVVTAGSSLPCWTRCFKCEDLECPFPWK